LGGEKLNRFRLFLAVILISAAGSANGGLSAQTPGPSGAAGPGAAETSPAAAETPGAATPAAAPAQLDESLIVLGEVPEAPGAGPSSFPVVLRMVLVLALTAAAIYGIVFWLKRVTRPPEQTNPHLKVLASVPLAPGRSVHVVSVGSKTWLLGAGDGGVSLIAEITDQEAEVAAMLQDDSQRRSAAPRFSDFKSLLRRLGGNLPDRRPGPENVRRRRERLKGL
jgi:flagellar protein FliO/FliZ